MTLAELRKAQPGTSIWLSVASAPDRAREGTGPPEQTAGHIRPSLSRKAAPLTISLTYDGDSNRKTLTRTAGLGTVAETPTVMTPIAGSRCSTTPPVRQPLSRASFSATIPAAGSRHDGFAQAPKAEMLRCLDHRLLKIGVLESSHGFLRSFTCQSFACLSAARMPKSNPER
jgi:hypothetical protein